MDIKKLLYVTKFEELCFDALQTLLTLRDASLEHVVFVNVIERENVAMARGRGYLKGEARRLRERANIRFIDWAEHLFVQGMEVGVYIVVGSVVPKVMMAACNEGADLIVIGRPHKGYLEQLYSGSDVTELLRRVNIPVLVYKHLLEEGAHQSERPFSRPLLATDWSPASLKAVEYLTPLKGIIEKLQIVNVAEERQLSGSDSMKIQKTRKERRTKLEELCKQFEEAGIAAEPHVYVGEAEREIERAAHDLRATMIVMGSSGRSAWREHWLGSTPRTVSENSAYPTLLIPLKPPTC